MAPSLSFVRLTGFSDPMPSLDYFKNTSFRHLFEFFLRIFLVKYYVKLKTKWDTIFLKFHFLANSAIVEKDSRSQGLIFLCILFLGVSGHYIYLLGKYLLFHI